MSQENEQSGPPQEPPHYGPPGGMPPQEPPHYGPPGGMPPQEPPHYGPPGAMPPQYGAPGVQPQGPPHYGPPGAQPVPPVMPGPEGGEPKKKNPALPWIIATVIAALLAVVGFGWGYTQMRSAQDAAAQSAAAMQQAQAALEKSQSEDAALQQEVDELQSEYAKVEKKYKTTEKNLKGETSQLNNLEKEYNDAKKQAAADEATLKDQVAASQAKAALAQKCAQVMATGLRLIYDATSYNQAMKDVVKEMQRASDSCEGIINFN